MVAIGGFTSSLNMASRQLSKASADETRLINSISNSGLDFRNRTTSSIIARKTQSQMINWDHSASINERTIERLDRYFNYVDSYYEIYGKMRDLAILGSDASQNQQFRDSIASDINAYNDVLRATGKIYQSSGTPINLQAPEEIYDASIGTNTNQIFTINYGDVNDEYDVFLEEGGSYYGADLGTGLSAATLATYIDTFDASGVYQGGTPFTNPDYMPYGFEERYRFFLGGKSKAQAVEIARDHAIKMNDTLEGAIARIEQVDYETQSFHLERARQQKQLAVSAMAVANQAQQAYVQTLQYASQNSARLANFYL